MSRKNLVSHWSELNNKVAVPSVFLIETKDSPEPPDEKEQPLRLRFFLPSQFLPRVGVCKLQFTGIDSNKSIVASAGIVKQSIEARNRVGIGLSYRHARLYSLTELIFLESILGFLKN
jgi:hypothetical protein